MTLDGGRQLRVLCTSTGRAGQVRALAPVAKALRSRGHHVQWAISDDGGSRVAAMSKLLSEYVREHIYLTFQADCVAFKIVDHVNWRRLCWASDFPHSDSTWP